MTFRDAASLAEAKSRISLVEPVALSEGPLLTEIIHAIFTFKLTISIPHASSWHKVVNLLEDPSKSSTEATASVDIEIVSWLEKARVGMALNRQPMQPYEAAFLCSSW